MFHVGMKVVATLVPKDTPRPPSHLRATPLKEGVIYTVRDVDMRTVPLHGVVTVRVEEVINHSILTTVGEWELGYHPLSLRPIQERSTETGMAILRKVADDAAKRKNLIGVA